MVCHRGDQSAAAVASFAEIAWAKRTLGEQLEHQSIYCGSASFHRVQREGVTTWLVLVPDAERGIKSARIEGSHGLHLKQAIGEIEQRAAWVGGVATSA